MKVASSRFAVGASIVALGLVTACNGAKSVSIDPANPQLTEAGQKTTLHPVFKSASGEVLQKGKPVTWSSSKPDVATVDAAGVVTAVKSGEASIRVVSAKSLFADALEGATIVNVSIPSRVSVADVELVGVGQGVTIKPTVVDDVGRPTKVPPSQIDVKVAEPSIAAIAVAGEQQEERYITAIGVGETKAVATVGKVSTEFKITVKLPEFSEVKLDNTELKLKAGETGKLVAKALAGEKEASGVPFAFSSSDAAIATVDAQGTINAVATGKATIEVKAGDKTASAVVTVAK